MSADPQATFSPTTEAGPGAAVARRGGAGALLSLSLAVALVALLMAGILWEKLEQTQQALARQSADSGSDAKAARETAEQNESTVQELQARLSVAEVRLSEVSLQRSQLEELMVSVSRSRDDHLVQELESTLQLAQQQAQLTGSAQLLISALQGADQRIARATQPRLNPVQRAIARDIERIRSASTTDIAALAGRLDEMVKLVDDLPLVNAPATVGAVRPPVGPASPASQSGVVGRPLESQPEPATPAVQGLELPEPVEQWRQRTSAALSRWWTAVTSDARDLVRISRIDQPEALLLAPDQAVMLRHNLKMQLLNARLALLARQIPVAQVDVLSTTSAIRRYFDTQALVTRNVLRGLDQVQSAMKTTDLPRPTETLAALATAAAGR